MDFEQTQIGFNVVGLQHYIDDLNMQVFNRIRRLIDNTRDLENAVEREWRGQAADNFIQNLMTGSRELLNKVEEVRETINTRLDSLQQQMLDMDANLVDLD